MRRGSKPELLALALLAYVPFLLSSPGQVSADSKQYLYLDPGRFLARAVDLWDPSFGTGTVPHQHLGYAFPVAPLFWVLEQVGLPDWVAQRLWLGTLTFLAAAGARWLFRELGIGRAGAVAGALVYGFTPYQLAFTARISVLLMPWAALPWLVGLTARASRTRDWRAPAALGLVLVLTGGINASALVLVALGPVLWVVLDAARGRAAAVAAVRAAGRIGVVGLAVSIWWLVGLRLQGSHGLPVLQLTEDLRLVAERSSPDDVLRGLGNWFFYGRDAAGYSLDQAADYDSDRLVIALSFVVPVGALAAALCLRWAHRAYFALLVVVGLVVAVGSWPPDDPSPYGSVWERVTETSAGLALRNSPRAVPLVVLGLAGLLAAWVGGLRRPRWARLAAAGVGLAALAALLPVWREGYLSEGVDRPEEIPDYWLDAIRDLDAGDHGTRILELPGSTFAAYRWGDLVEPLTPGLTDRPYVAREVLPYGTPPSVNLLDALDRRAQLGVLEPASIAPIARLLGVGTISLRADLEVSSRGFAPDPGPVWDALQAADGLRPPRTFGPAGGDGTDPSLPSVALFDVEGVRPIVRTSPVVAPTVLAGDGDGLVDAAAAGLLDGRSPVLEVAALDEAALDRALEEEAHLVLTDSNRRRIQTWFYSLRDSRGPTERAGRVAPDPTGFDFRLDPFPGTGDDSRTVVEQVGGTVEVTSEGGPDRPEDRGAHAVDGNPATAWRVGGPDPRGQALTLLPETPVRADVVHLRQPDWSGGARHVSRVRVTTDGGTSVEVDLGPDAGEGRGQAVAIPEQVVASLRVEVLATIGAPGDMTPVGFAEIGLGGTRVDEVVRLPTDLLDRVGRRLEGHSLDVVLTRLRLELPGLDRQDDEAVLDRRFELPQTRTFSLTATVRPAADGSDAQGSGSCRDDLLEVDGRPVPVRFTDAAEPAGVVACEPLVLDAGSHRVVAALGRDTGLDVDRVVLSSAADGEPGVVAPRGGDGEEGPALRIVDQSAASIDVAIDAASEPFWLVLGQSSSDGWDADVEGATVGPRTLVDGYANGWLVTPDGSGRIEVELTWRPQRLVWAGIGVSALAAAACAVIVLRGRRGRRPVSVGLASVPRSVLPGDDGRASGRTALLAVAIVGAAAVLVATPGVALAAAVVTAAAALVPRGRWLLLVAPAALVLARPMERPSLAWLAVALVAADLILARDEVREPRGV